MPVLLQVCIVIVTIAVLVLALQTARIVRRIFTKTKPDLLELTGAFRESADQMGRISREARELAASSRTCVQPVQRVATRFKVLGRRTADVHHLLKRLTHGFTHRNSQSMEITMNDTSDSRGAPGSTLMGFVLGAAVGAGLALLLAPDTGRKTRERLTSTARRWSKDAGEAMEHARDAMVDLGANAKSALEAGKEALAQERVTREARTERWQAADAAPDAKSK